MGKKKAVPAAPKASVFIGSSKEGLTIAQAIGANLEHVVHPDIWPNAFDLSDTTIESLEKATEMHQFAILVFTDDDEVKYRGKKLTAARDNVLWEHGLFSGKIGRKRTFIVMPSGVQKFKLPTDLLGITVATYYPERLGDNPKSALQTACFEITQAIERAIKAEAEAVALPSATPPPALTSIKPAVQPELRGRASRHVADLLSMLGGGAAGLSIVQNDVKKLKRWTDNLLNMVRDVFRLKQDDVYVAWMRPDHSEPPELAYYASEGLGDLNMHHNFTAGEGLAGNAWSQGKAVGHSLGRTHAWWVLRKGCENMTYLCAPVGDFKGTGGLLGVGSDRGFEISDDDLGIIEMFASLLGFVAHLMPLPASIPKTVPMKRASSSGSRNRSGV